MLKNIISTSRKYNSSTLNNDIQSLIKKFPFISLEIAGFSTLNSPIYVLKLGNGPKKVFYSAAFHANEWITSLILMKFVEDYANAFVNNSLLFGCSARTLYDNCSIYLMPMVNPDGVDLVTGLLDNNSSEYTLAKQIASYYPNICFPDCWKANIRGVDLNLQFPAMWQNAKKIKYFQGYTKPSPRDFVGYSPLSESESLAVYNFTLKHNFELILAYHTQGKEIYWNFQNYKPKNGFELGKKLASASGYKLTNVPYNSSFAGFKDWFIQKYNKPRFYYRSWIRQKSFAFVTI